MPTIEINVDEHGIPVNGAGQYAFPPKTFVDRKRNVAQILWCLHYDGPFADKGGMAVAKLNDALATRRVIVSHQVLNTILKDLDHPGAKYGHMIRRKCPPGGKRTYLIELLHDPSEVPFPANPWPHEAKAAFEKRGDAHTTVVNLDADDEDHTELEETFTRHARRTNGQGPKVDVMERLYEADRELKAKANGNIQDLGDVASYEPEEEEMSPDIVAAVERMIEETPIPQPEPEEPEPVEEPREPEPAPATNGLVAVERAPAVPLDGEDLDLTDLGIDLGGPAPAGGYATYLTQAIELITTAITAKATEEANRHEDVGLLVDQRMTAYIRLNDENAALRSKLARSVQREQELLSLVRTLKATVVKLRGAQ